MITALLLTLLAVGADAVPPVRAQADLRIYFRMNDYPAEAALRAQVGTVAFTLDVGADGRVAACRITASSGSFALDETTCRILTERARFMPARDAAGAAVPDQFSDRVTWTLPEPPTGARAMTNLGNYISDRDYPPAALREHQQGRVGFELDITPEGRAVTCRIVETSGSSLLDLRTCQAMIVRARFAPARDAAGNPAPDTVTGRVRWVIPQD